MQVKVLIADDHPLFRRGLSDFLDSQLEFQVVAEAGNSNEVLKYLQTMPVDIVLLDINIPDCDGFELLSMIRHRAMPVKIVMLTMYDEIVYAKRAFDLGADGYLLKDDAEILIEECLSSVINGNQFCSLGDPNKLNDEIHQELSPTEKHILNLVGTGKTSIEIADMLSVSVRTIDNHRAHITSKLNLKGSNALLKYALQHRKSNT